MSVERDSFQEGTAEQVALWNQFLEMDAPSFLRLADLITDAKSDFVAGKAIELLLATNLRPLLDEDTQSRKLFISELTPDTWKGVSPKRLKYAMAVAVRNLDSLAPIRKEPHHGRQLLNRALITLFLNSPDENTAAQILEKIDYTDKIYAWHEDFDPMTLILSRDTVNNKEWLISIVLKDIHRRIVEQKANGSIKAYESIAYSFAHALALLPHWPDSIRGTYSFIPVQVASIIREYIEGIDGFFVSSNGPSDQYDIFRLLEEPRYFEEKVLYYSRELRFNRIHIHGAHHYILGTEMLPYLVDADLKEKLSALLSNYLYKSKERQAENELYKGRYEAQQILARKLKDA